MRRVLVAVAGIIIIVAGFGSYFILDSSQKVLDDSELACSIDSECVPAEACHPTTCINEKFAPNTDGIACTMSCESGTMDCDQGYCACINNKCEAVIRNPI